MKKTYMLDTNICSYIMRHRADVYGRFLNELRAGSNIVISVITYVELSTGANLPKAPKTARAKLGKFLPMIGGIIDLDVGTADAAAEIERVLAAKGQRIGFSDTLIAAHAITANCICVTNNTREFARVPGLVLENWAA